MSRDDFYAVVELSQGGYGIYWPSASELDNWYSYQSGERWEGCEVYNYPTFEEYLVANREQLAWARTEKEAREKVRELIWKVGFPPEHGVEYYTRPGKSMELLDANDREIREGDILLAPDNSEYRIRFGFYDTGGENRIYGYGWYLEGTDTKPIDPREIVDGKMMYRRA